MFTDKYLIMEKSKKIVLFDIDYTLFDTDAYRQILYPRLAEELGIDEKSLRKFRLEIEPEMKDTYGHFSPSFFLKKILLLSTKNSSSEKLEEIFWNKIMYANVVDTSSKIVFETLKKNHINIGLLSTGDTKHQLAKIESLIAYIPNDYHHIFPNKKNFLSEVLQKYQDYKIFIVDDLPEVLYLAKQIDPNITTILKRTPTTHETTNDIKNFKPDFEINSLIEILDITR